MTNLSTYINIDGNQVTANTISGNGGQIANITAANITGTVAVASVASTAYSVDGANVAGTVGNANVAYSVAGANVSGSVALANTAYAVSGSNVSGAVALANVAYGVAGANVSGTVATANTVVDNAQPNITSVGTLSTLSVTGNISTTANISSGNVIATAFFGDGSNLTNVADSLPHPNNLLYVAKNGNDSTGTGSINAPYLTIQNAINVANALPSAATIILAPGSYVQDLTIANVPNGLNITGSGLTESAINGNITISGTSNNIEFDNFRISTGRVTHSASGYWSVLNLRFSANTGITKTSSATIKLFNTDLGAAGTGSVLLQAGKTNIYNCQVFNPQVSGTTTEVNFLQCDTVLLPTVTAGNVNFINSIIVSSGTGNSLNAVGGNITMASSLSITPTRALAPINFGASSRYQYGDSAFDLANTTFAGTAIPQDAQFQAINVRGNVVTTGNISGPNVVVTSNTAATDTTTGALQVTGGAGVTGNLYAGNLIGTGIAGTLLTASQPNITSLGIITSLTAGAATFSGQLTANGNAQFNGDAYFAGNVTIPGNINQISGNSGQFFGNVVTGFNALYAGLPAGYTLLSQEITQFSASFNGYTQTSLQNLNGGDEATGDFVITADNGTDFINHIDMGIAGSGYDGAIAYANNALGTSLLPNDGYLYTRGNVTGGNLVLGSNQANGVVRIIANGASNLADVVATFAASGLNVNGTVTATSFTGNGAALTSITGANVTGTVANATYATSSGSATTAATVTTATQPNITSVGTLSSLSVTGNASAAFFTGNGSALTGIVSSYGNANVALYLANTSTNGNIFANEVTAKQLAVPYANTNAYDANIIVLNGNSLYRSNSSIAANIPFAIGNTANTWSLAKQWVAPYQQFWVDPTNGLDTNDGSLSNPVQTVARGQVSLANRFGVLSLLPGTYSEDVTWTKQNTTITGPGAGDMVNLTGNWDFTSNGTSVRVQGVGFAANVTHTGTSGLYLFQCSYSGNLNLNSAAIFVAENCNLANGPILLNPGNATTQYTNINNCTFNDMVINGNTTVTINNSQSNNSNIALDLGTLIIYNSTILSEENGNTVMTTSNVSNVIINGSTFADPDGTAAIINIAGGYSFGGVNYDSANSVITGSSFGDYQYFDKISVVSFLKAAAIIETRVVPRANGVASGSTVTIDANAVDQYAIVALATGVTIAAPTGTLTDGQKLTIRIRDNTIAQTITWNAIFRPIGTTLPTTTVAGKLVYVGCIYNVLDAKWDVVSVAQEA
jgi:hypothetical protein